MSPSAPRSVLWLAGGKMKYFWIFLAVWGLWVRWKCELLAEMWSHAFISVSSCSLSPFLSVFIFRPFCMDWVCNWPVFLLVDTVCSVDTKVPQGHPHSGRYIHDFDGTRQCQFSFSTQRCEAQFFKSFIVFNSNHSLKSCAIFVHQRQVLPFPRLVLLLKVLQIRLVFQYQIGDHTRVGKVLVFVR